VARYPWDTLDICVCILLITEHNVDVSRGNYKYLFKTLQIPIVQPVILLFRNISQVLMLMYKFRTVRDLTVETETTRAKYIICSLSFQLSS
jgi:hypothetical protein